MAHPQSFVLLDPQRRPGGGTRTLAEHKTTQIVKQFRDAISNGKIEEAVHWSGELVVSGSVWQIWDTLFAITALYYYNHRQMVVYMLDRYKRFRQAAANMADIELRNLGMVRSIIAEAAAVLASGDRRFKATRTPVADEMFALDHLRPRLRAPTRDLARPYILDDDPPEAAMCANEFAHALTTQRLGDAQFWVEWIVALQRRCTKQKQPCVCGIRGTPSMAPKLRTTPSLLLWHVLRGVAASSPKLDTTVAAWEALYLVKYSGRVNTTRAMLLLAATFAVCNRTTLIPTLPVANTRLVPAVISGLPKIYERLAKQCGLECVTEAAPQSAAEAGAERAAQGTRLLQLLTPTRRPRTG